MLAAADPLTAYAPLVLVGGMVLLFACARVLPSTLATRLDHNGLRAVGFFLPIAFACVTAMLLGRTEIAVGIVFGTSVGAMTTVIGFVAMGAPIGGGPGRWQRIWAFQLAAALLVFVAGFKGWFSWRDAVALLTEGLVLLTLWHDHRNEPRPVEPIHAPPDRPGAIRAIELALAGVAMWLGGWAITVGTVRTHTLIPHFSTSALAGTVVSLSMVMPMMYGTWRLAEGGKSWAPMTTQVGVVLLNLCLLLPILILMPYAASKLPFLSHWSGNALVWHEGLAKVLNYPAAVWRIDNVVLIIVGVFLLPVTVGKWALGREEGMFLIGGYFFYLTATLAGG